MSTSTIKHPCVPVTLTPEALADWIQTQKVDVRNHVEEIPLTEDEIVELEHSSSLASRAMDRLTEVKKYFEAYLKKGTPFDKATEQNKPMTVTIPPTKGMDALKANREYADKQIALGHKQDVTALYLIPYPEHSRMIMVNIVGVEWPEYSRDMSADEINQYKPLLKRVAESSLAAPVDGENETLADTATVKEEKKKKTRSQRIEDQKAADDALFADLDKVQVEGTNEGDAEAPGSGESTDSDLPFEMQ